ncbi:CheR family methyltransferase [Candidatus Nitrospira inopinata]|jgi:chemotaxis protein methyltransferase CheR|uniref:protein-glutamate O-methyltransferase n=1 Tax=Candidatus Nitrospira inopinata TaxID=1715989 RepID=A0A0S4KVR8_9BACT|nr:protein-glutamate O-methyltransferase [Candidatus Nitrospira inopinata]CUQ67262.1 chemotaxis regulator, protein-glutamate methyltransferase [Candidatus Nitrospira inopinata]
MMYSITRDEFRRFQKLIYDESGIALNDQKESLLVSRLMKRLRELGVDTFSEYYEKVTGDPTGEEFTKLLDCVSTNKTDFFREPRHFAFLREQILPQLERDKRVRIWSSACSTGEEPYTIAITLYEGVRDPAQWDFKILASDLSTRVLARAASGVYEEERLRDVEPAVLRRHFLRGRGEREGLFKIKPHLASVVRFRRINLMDDQFPIKTPLDVIFCRNVMIYFDRPTQEQLVNKFHRYLKPGGYLCIGHSESLQWVRHPFKLVAPTIYRKEL